MKNLKVATGILAMAFLTFVVLSCKGEAKNNNESALQTKEVKQLANVSISFGVRGNCGMCKKTIEKAVNSLEGISKANWDVDKKKMDVSFDDSKTNEMAIHNAIAASGYDTEKVSADLEAYNGLAGCCQYDHEMAMNQN
jgi:mercuric ion binding protein